MWMSVLFELALSVLPIATARADVPDWSGLDAHFFTGPIPPQGTTLASVPLDPALSLTGAGPEHLPVILPLVQRRAVDVPPATVLFAIAAFGVLFGWLGVIFAVPLAVVVMVVVQKFWIRQTLGEEATVPGEGKGEPRRKPSRSRER